jgi:hypothetical protein
LEIRVLRRIFLPMREEETSDWVNLHIELLYDVYSSQYVIRVIESRRSTWLGNVAVTGENGGAYRVLVGKPEGKRPKETNWKTHS